MTKTSPRRRIKPKQDGITPGMIENSARSRHHIAIIAGTRHCSRWPQTFRARYYSLKVLFIYALYVWRELLSTLVWRIRSDSEKPSPGVILEQFGRADIAQEHLELLLPRHFLHLG